MAATDDILGSLPLDQIAQEVGASPAEVQQAAAAAIPALLGGLQANANDAAGASSILGALGQHDTDLLDGGVDLGQVDPVDGAQIASHIFGSNEEQVYSALGGSSAAGSVGSALIKKLIPILAPIVLSYLAKQVLGKVGGGSAGSGSGSGGGLGDILGSILGGGSAAPADDSNSAGSGAPSLPTRNPDAGPAGEVTTTNPATADHSADSGSRPSAGGLGDILKDVLGSAVGGATSSVGGAGGILGDVLGGLLGGGRR